MFPNCSESPPPPLPPPNEDLSNFIHPYVLCTLDLYIKRKRHMFLHPIFSESVCQIKSLISSL